MLVLTRKLREQIHIGKDITITIVRVKGQTVRLGVEAPSDVKVLRAELPSFDDVDPNDRKKDTAKRAGAAAELETTESVRTLPLGTSEANSRARKPARRGLAVRESKFAPVVAHAV